MKTIQEKIEAIANGERIDAVTDCINSLCNIEVNAGKVIVIAKHRISPLLITNAKEVDNNVPEGIYIIAVPEDKYANWLGKEVVLDLAYGGRGVSMNTKITNNGKKLIDVLGGETNLKFEDNKPTISDKSKIIVKDNKVEFWDATLINLNQIGGIVY